jgi:pyruvate dehydrogenase E2 component (dihydrolipoamide acetyltransferase)
MADEIITTTEGMLLNWLVAEGESVSEGDIVAEFEADKATVEVESPASGTVLELLADVGDELEEGVVIARIGESGEAPADSDDDTDEPDTTDDTGEAAQADAAETEATADDEAAATEAPSGEDVAARTPDGRIKASPLARNIAADKGIDLKHIRGTGPGGRITKSDVESYEPSQAAQDAPSAAARTEPKGAPTADVVSARSWDDLPEGDHVDIEDITRMRKLIARGTVRTWNSTPHFYVTIEVDMEPLLAMRRDLNETLADEGIKISVNDLIVKAAALTLRQFPNLNSHYYGDKLVRHNQVNISIAVALEDGLVNVVSPDADKTSLGEMAQFHKELFARVRDGKIKPDDLKGGTFLVSNLGAFDVENFSSIIEAPQAGALAVGSAKRQPVVQSDGSLGVGTRMKVTLSIDHRVSDGAEGAQWLNHFRELIENPMRLLV